MVVGLEDEIELVRCALENCFSDFGNSDRREASSPTTFVLLVFAEEEAPLDKGDGLDRLKFPAGTDASGNWASQVRRLAE